MQTAIFVLAFLAALGAGLMAGFFYAFSAVVMPAFARCPAAEAAAAMQAINVVVLNPLFFVLFFGTGAAGLALSLLGLLALRPPDAALATGAAAVYLFGSIGVTMARNVPLNQDLARAAPEAAAALWPRYLRDWTFWNTVRTFACLIACAGFILAIV